MNLICHKEEFLEEVYYINSRGEKIYHNDNGPAIIVRHENHKPSYEGWFFHNQFHRLNKPAKILYFDDGYPKEEVYIVNDEIHRSLGPAIVRYKQLTHFYVIKNQEFWNNGKLQRIIHGNPINESGEACIEEFYQDFSKIAENKIYNDVLFSTRIFKNNKLHNENGPAIIHHQNIFQNKQFEEYFVNGIKLSKEEFIAYSFHLETFSN